MLIRTHPPSRPRIRRERGTVMVLVAAAMFPIIGMMTFAIDVSHWFDYSRNLQNRADAAALAGGQMLESCISKVGNPGTTTNGLQSTAGKWAQLFTGASVSEGPAQQGTPNLPYTDTAVAAPTTDAAGSGNGPGTGYGSAFLTNDGYINNMSATYNDPSNALNPFNGTYSPLTLRAALSNINNFWAAFNASDYSPSGGANTSFTLGPVGTASTFCSSNPTYDQTDGQCRTQSHTLTTGPCAPAPMVDVKLTQQNIPLFVPLFSGLNPTIHAHARVTLQGEASSADVRPVAVSDPGSFSCAWVYFRNANTNDLLGTAKLAQTDPANFVWDNASTVVDPVSGQVISSGPLSFTMPSNANVYGQVFLHDCGTPPNGETFDDATNTGLLYINSAPSTVPVINTTNGAPQLSVGGTVLTGSCSPDQYFFVGACNVGVTTYVKFNPTVQQSKTNVSAIDWEWDPNANGGAGGFVATSNSAKLTQDNTDPTKWASQGNAQLLKFADSTGDHMIEITWEQDAGNVGAKACTQSNPCAGTFGFQTGAFTACNACNPADDSGPVVLAQLCTSSAFPCSGANSFTSGQAIPGGGLVVKLQLAGIRADTTAGAKPTIIRFPVSGNHQTGLVDCGQGQGGNNDTYTVYGGCGPNNPFEPTQCQTTPGITCQLPALNPMYVYARGAGPTDCSPEQDQNYTGWPDSNHQDCVQTTPGTRRTSIICALLQRITGVTAQNFSGSSNACNQNFAASCPYNYWPNPDTIANDSRKVTFILTSPVDLAAAGNSPDFWIPIRRFATFYVTGWDQSLFPKCGNSGKNGENDPFPGTGKASQNASIWGHWIEDVDLGVSNGNPCDTSSPEPTNCVAALTR
jgi:hypothetical protein